MTETYGPFASGQGAILSAIDWGQIFGLIQSSGVVPGVGNELQVYADGGGYYVKVKTGGGWISGFGYRSSEEIQLTINPPHATLDRRDRAVLELDIPGSIITPTILTGNTATPTTPPALTQTDLIWQVPLAQVTVTHGVASIAADKVTDERVYAASNVAQRQVTKWLPAAAFAVTLGTNIAYTDTLGPGAFVLPANQNTRLASAWTVPNDWVSGAIGVSVYWAPDNANAGTVQWQYRHSGPTVETGTVSATSDPVVAQAAPGVANSLRRQAGFPSLTPTSVGQLIGLGVGRNTSGNTFTGNVLFYGVQFTYNGR